MHTNQTLREAGGQSPLFPKGLETTALQCKLLLKSDEAAVLLSISPRTLWNLARTGVIKPVKIGRSVRFDFDELREFISRAKL